MSYRQIKEEMQEYIMELPNVERVNHKQLVMRCVFCGDSRRDRNKKRLYIKVDCDNDDEPVLYNCYNCGVSGVVTPTILRELGCDNNLHLNSSITKMNNSAKRKQPRGNSIKGNKLKLKVPLYEESKINNYKKSYIENRLGIKLSYEELQRFKCILNLGDFLEYNNYKTYTRNDKTMMNLHNYYAGFLTTNNEFVNLRNVTNRDLKRYENYSMYNNMDNTHRFYTIPCDIDVFSNDTIEIIIAEGVFDILGVYYHIYGGGSTRNKLFIAACGSAFTSIIKYVLGLGIIGDNVVMDIYSDKDKDLNYYKRVIKIDSFKSWLGGINIYYNNKEKDYGVTGDKIELLKYKIR